MQAARNISVIVCTYNRCQFLASALGSVAQSLLPEGVTWEILVVDNNSTDQTREIVNGFSLKWPGRFRYVLEPRQGKAYALNSGIREAVGKLLAFIDDDVVVDANWLANLTAELQSGEWSGAGGRVLRMWGCPVPPWLSLKRRYEVMGWPLVSFELNQEAGELRISPVGTNMASALW